MKKIKTVALGLATLCLQAGTSWADPAGAEPLNDQMPAFGLTPAVVAFEKFSGELQFGYQIGSPSDHDHFVIACPTTDLRLLGAAIVFNHAQGDLDMRMWKVNQSGSPTLLGVSQGTTNQEEVIVYYEGLSTAVLEVYGYNGAQGSYSVAIHCRPYTAE
jgi:hypothetical protein